MKLDENRLTTSRTVLATAIALAISVSVAPTVSVADVCTTETTIISGYTNGVCNLASGESIVVDGDGLFVGDGYPTEGAAFAAIGVADGVDAGSIVNDGQILDSTYNVPLIKIEGSLSGGIINSGDMRSASTGLETGISISSGSLNGGIKNTGSILAHNGISIINSAVTGGISNLIDGEKIGQIIATDTDGAVAINIEDSTFTGDIINEGEIKSINAGTDHYGAAINIESSTFIGSINNSGLIHHKGEYLGAAIVVKGDGFTGDINNSGTISADEGYGIKIGDKDYAPHDEAPYSIDFIGNITNSGEISATNEDAIAIYYSYLDGDIHNTKTGKISAINEDALEIEDSRVTGNITNEGTIEAFGVDGPAVVISDSIIDGYISNSGEISAVEEEALYIDDSIINGYISNSGTISSEEDEAIYIGHSTVGGYISNSGVLSSEAYDALDINGSTVTGGIVNSETMIGGYNGIGIYNGALIDGNIENSGTIQASETELSSESAWMAGINVYHYSTVSGAIINTVEGEISGDNYGISIEDTTDVFGGIENHGDITGGLDGIHVVTSSSLEGGLTNTGTISGGDNGLRIDSGSSISGGITNSGRISGGQKAISVAFGSTVDQITNSGTIESINETTTAVAISLAHSTDGIGSVTNSGLISGFTGISVKNSTIGSVSNTVSSGKAGVINGTNYGVLLRSGGHVDGGMLNEGTISAGVDGIHLMNGSSIYELTNSGTISGGTHSIYVDSFSSLSILNNQVGGVLDGNLVIDDENAVVTNAGTIKLPISAESYIGKSDEGFVGGAYTQTATGILSIAAASVSDYSQLAIGGTASFSADTTINVSLDAGHTIEAGHSLNDVVSAGTLSSSAFNVTDNSLAFQFIAIDDSSNNIDLTVVGTGLTTLQAATVSTGTSAAKEAAGRLDDIIANKPTGKLANAFGSAGTEQELSDAVESTLPGVSGGVSQLTNISTNAVVSVVASRQDVTRGLSSGDVFMTDRHFWFKPFGGKTNQDDRQGVTGYDIDSYGLAAGFDGDVSSTWNVGFAFAYINSDVESNLAVGKHTVDMDSYQAKVYATAMLDDVTALNLQVGVGHSEYDSHRRIFTGDVASADYDSWNVQLNAELERSYQVSDKTVVTPYVHADYSYVNVEDYNESGAGALNLMVQDDSADSLIFGVGVKGNHTVSESLLLMANAGIGYDAMADQSNLTSSFSGGGAQFTTQGIKPDEVVYNAGIGAKYSLENGTEITARYDIDGREDYTDQSISANFRVLF